MLDYGDSNKLGEPVLLQLEISNPTAIPTSYEAHVSHFPAAKPPTPPTQPMPSTYSVLLHVHMYIHVTCVHVGEGSHCWLSFQTCSMQL